MKKSLMLSALIALVISLTGLALGLYLFKERSIRVEHISAPQNTLFTKNANNEIVPLDFTEVCEKVVDAVVHVESSYLVNSRQQDYNQLPDPFRDFFQGDPFYKFFQTPKNEDRRNQEQMPQRRIGSGSGVIINEKGYIITNNHVIDGAEEIQVTLHDNRNYMATVVGTDPATDLALLQIKEEGLPTLPLMNSDEVKVGEWVLAVGNPFSLNSTVTAGIVSAKARNINILREQFAVESFIQTDAAINPGNSGGALVNLNGGLVGINTAIQTRTGSYNGYGFAIPANIVNKVIEDLLKFGSVQRGVLGVMIRSIDGNLADEKNLDLTEGVYVDSLLENSAAGKAGVNVGDVIIGVNNITVKSSPELQEVIARYRPGDKVNLKIDRNGSIQNINVVLSNLNKSVAAVSTEHKMMLNKLGIEVENMDSKLAKKLGLESGVQITKIFSGKIMRETKIRNGFIITHVDGKSVYSASDFLNSLSSKKGGVMLEGIYENLPGKYYYAVGMDS